MSKRITLKRAFMKTLRRDFGFRVPQAKAAYRALIETLAEHILDEDTIIIPGFGKFYITKRPAHEINTPFTDGPVMVPEKSRIRFRPSEALKKAINGEEQ